MCIKLENFNKFCKVFVVYCNVLESGWILGLDRYGVKFYFIV